MKFVDKRRVVRVKINNTETKRLDELCLTITDGSHTSPKGIETGYPMFSVKDMGEYGFSYEGCKFISKHDFDEMVKNGCIPKKDDILLAKDGSILERIFVMKKDCDGAILSSIAILRLNCNLISPSYLCYFLKNPTTKNTYRRM